MSEFTDVHPAIAPYVFYEDTVAAVDWLERVYGFTSRYPVERDETGRVDHAEVQLGDALVMLSDGRDEGGAFRNPEHLGGATVGMYVRVDDVDTHFDHAKAEGAVITQAPEDQPYGARLYETRDPEGHLWWFWSPVGE